MNTKWRRFEVMLPRQFNDGREVPAEWISLAVLEIGDHFGSVSYETQIIEGCWQQAGVVYRDSLARVVVDMPDRTAAALSASPRFVHTDGANRHSATRFASGRDRPTCSRSSFGHFYAAVDPAP